MEFSLENTIGELTEIVSDVCYEVSVDLNPEKDDPITVGVYSTVNDALRILKETVDKFVHDPIGYDDHVLVRLKSRRMI